MARALFWVSKNSFAFFLYASAAAPITYKFLSLAVSISLACAIKVLYSNTLAVVRHSP